MIIYERNNYQVTKDSDSGELNVWEIYHTSEKHGIIDLGKSEWLYNSNLMGVGNIDDLPEDIQNVIIKEEI